MRNLEKIFNLMAVDGMKHFIVSATLTAMLALILPGWAAMLATMAVGGAKEIYDRISGRGSAEGKDVICNLCGTIVGGI